MKIENLQRASILSVDLHKLKMAIAKLGTDNSGVAATLHNHASTGEKWMFAVGFDDTLAILRGKAQRIEDELLELGVELPPGGIG